MDNLPTVGAGYARGRASGYRVGSPSLSAFDPSWRILPTTALAVGSIELYLSAVARRAAIWEDTASSHGLPAPVGGPPEREQIATVITNTGDASPPMHLVLYYNSSLWQWYTAMTPASACGAGAGRDASLSLYLLGLWEILFEAFSARKDATTCLGKIEHPTRQRSWLSIRLQDDDPDLDSWSALWPCAPHGASGSEQANNQAAGADQVADFIRREGIDANVHKADSLVRELFPQVRTVRCEVSRDPEESAEWIVVEVASTASPAELTAAYREYIKRWVRETPPEKRRLVRLSYTRV
jgi:hypothetical protein